MTMILRLVSAMKVLSVFKSVGYQMDWENMASPTLKCLGKVFGEVFFLFTLSLLLIRLHCIYPAPSCHYQLQLWYPPSVIS